MIGQEKVGYKDGRIQEWKGRKEFCGEMLPKMFSSPLNGYDLKERKG